MIKRIADLIMIFNLLLASLIILPGCDFTFDRPEFGVTMKTEKINGADAVTYSCVKWQRTRAIPLQLCDTKGECNAYCDKAREAFQRKAGL